MLHNQFPTVNCWVDHFESFVCINLQYIVCSCLSQVETLHKSSVTIWRLFGQNNIPNLVCRLSHFKNQRWLSESQILSRNKAIQKDIDSCNKKQIKWFLQQQREFLHTHFSGAVTLNENKDHQNYITCIATYPRKVLGNWRNLFICNVWNELKPMKCEMSNMTISKISEGCTGI